MSLTLTVRQSTITCKVNQPSTISCKVVQLGEITCEAAVSSKVTCAVVSPDGCQTIVKTNGYRTEAEIAAIAAGTGGCNNLHADSPNDGAVIDVHGNIFVSIGTLQTLP